MYMYTIQFAHNLDAVPGKQHSVIVLYREGKCNHANDSWKNGSAGSTCQQELALWGRLQRKPKKTSTIFQSIPLCAFASLAACQWKRGRSRTHPGGSKVRQIEAIAELSQQYGCSQDLLGVVPAFMNDALSIAMLVFHKEEERGIVGKRQLPGALSISFLLAAARSITW